MYCRRSMPSTLICSWTIKQFCFSVSTIALPYCCSTLYPAFDVLSKTYACHFRHASLPGPRTHDPSGMPLITSLSVFPGSEYFQILVCHQRPNQHLLLGKRQILCARALGYFGCRAAGTRYPARRCKSRLDQWKLE